MDNLLASNYYVDFVRIVLVVISHASYYSIITNYGGIYYGKEMIAQGVSDTFFHRISMNITLLIYCFHMPAFIVLSGYLFGKRLQSGQFMDVKELFLNIITLESTHYI